MNKNMMAKFKKAQELSEILKHLAHPTRLMIVCLLSEKELFALEILEQLGTTKGNISQHLKILFMANLICKRHETNRTYYKIKDKRLIQLINKMEYLYCSKSKREVL